MSTVAVDASPRTRRAFSASVTAGHTTDGANQRLMMGHVAIGASSRRVMSHVTDGAGRQVSSRTDGTSGHVDRLSGVDSKHDSHVTKHVSNNDSSIREQKGSVGNDSDEDSTAEEGGDTVPYESTTTDTLPDSVEPIDYIESRPSGYLDPAACNGHHTGGRGVAAEDHHRSESWSTSRVMKRSKASRVSKIERQRMPYQLPRPGKPKIPHVRPTPASRKRRFSGRVLRAPLSNASEGDMAQADEMGEGEGRDDGFVDCLEGVKKKGKKRSGVHVVLPSMASGSPPSSPSNTPVSRRRTSSRKSRPKPRPRKPTKPQLASADISTQETTTPGPGSSDTTDGSASHDETHPHNATENETLTTTRNEGTYEDIHIRSLTANIQSQASEEEEEPKGVFKDHYSCTNGVAAGNSPNMDKAQGLRLNQPLAPEIFPMKDSLQSNSEENLRIDSNETSDTDLTSLSHPSSPLRGVRHAWSNQRRESDFSTAPFSSETSDMDTSGNERAFTDGGSMSDLTCSKSDQVDHNLSPCASNNAAGTHLEYIPAATHLERIPAVSNLENISAVPNLETVTHLENIPAVTFSDNSRRVTIGGSSGDKIPKKRSSTKPPVGRKPAAILSGSGANKLTPPSPKRPLHASKSTPIPTGEKAKETSSHKQSVTHPKAGRSAVPPLPKPKPPPTAKLPKPMLRPKPTHLSSSEVTLKGRHPAPRQLSFDSTPEKDNSTSGVALSNYQRQSYLENTRSELALQTTHVDNDTRRTEHLGKTQRETDKKAPRLAAAAVRNPKMANKEELGDSGHSNYTSPTKPAVPAKPKQQGPEKRLHNKQTFSVDTQSERLRDTSTSCTDSSKSPSSSEATSGHSQSPNASPSSSPAVRKKPLPPQKPSVLPKRPALVHQSVSAGAILQSEEGKNQTSKPANRLDSAMMSSASQRAGKTPKFSLPAIVTELSSPPSTTPSDQSGNKNEEPPVIRWVAVPMATTAPSTNEQGPPLPPRKANRRSTHIELVIPGEDVPPELPPRKPRLSSPRRPPPSPPTQRRAPGEKRSTIARGSDVGHSNHPSADPKRHSMFSSHLTTNQIDTISENYEVCDFKEDEGFGGSADEVSLPQQVLKKPVRFKIQDSNPRASPDLLPSKAVDNLIGQSTDAKKGSDNEQESDSLTQLHANGGSARKRPPKPPKYPSFEEPVPLVQNSLKLTPPSLRQKAADPAHSPVARTPSDPSQEDTPPPLPTQPIPKKKDRYGSKKQSTSVTRLDHQRSSSRSPPPPQSPKMEDTGTTNKNPMRRNEPIYDVIQDVPRVDPYNTVVLVSKGKQEKDESPPPRSKSVPRKKKNESASSKLPHFGTHAKSNSVSLMYRRATSDRFKHRISTLDPEVLESLSKDISLRRTSSLDRLNDRMDHSSNALTDSSSDDEEVAVVSPIQRGLPKPHVSTFHSSDQSQKRKMERLGKSISMFVSTEDEPLYQYINTAEFLSSSMEARFTGHNRNQLEIARQLSRRSLWCEQPEVIQSGILNQISEEEKKLQEAMFEVITSEATYLRSLDVLISHFMEDPGMNPGLPEGRRVLDKRQHHVIFSNVREVRDTSARFLEQLQKRQRESAVVKNISDIILQYAEHHFDCYVHYCTNQIYQSRELQDCIETNIMFREYLRRLESHKRCQNLSMQSFLLLPMQRITRLPLLILAILNRTPLDHPDHELVEQTLRTVQKLVTSCNDGARKMERTEQLHFIHQKLDFGKLKPFPLVSVSRQLERKGTLMRLRVEQKLFGKQRAKRTPLYLFVFTDYLIITKRKKDPKGDYIYTVVDHSSRALVEVEDIESHPGVAFPKHIFGEQETVAMATWAVSTANVKHAFLVILLDNVYHKSEKYIFVAQTDTDKTRWMESITRPDIEKEEEKIYQHWDCPQVQAVFDYQAQQPDELSLERGDVVKVYRKMADGWYEGERLRDLQWGWFPSNFTMEIENEHTRARNLRETHRLLSLPFNPEEFSARMQNLT